MTGMAVQGGRNQLSSSRPSRLATHDSQIFGLPQLSTMPLCSSLITRLVTVNLYVGEAHVQATCRYARMQRDC